MNVFFNAAIKDVILASINGAVKNIHAAIYRFNDKEIYEALLNAREREVAVWLLIAEDDDNLDLVDLIEKGAHVYKISQDKKVLHHKFLITDRKHLITGSYNWTYGAFNNNYENIIKIEDAYELCNDFIDEFEKIKSEIDLMVKSLVDQVLAEETSMIDMLKDYVLFVTKYVEKYKKIPPKEILNQFYKNSHQSNSGTALTIIPTMDNGVNAPVIKPLAEYTAPHINYEEWWNGLLFAWKCYFNKVYLQREANGKMPSNFSDIFSRKNIYIHKSSSHYGKASICDLSGIVDLLNLEWVSVDGVSIKDICSLSKLVKLKYLEVVHCSLENLKGISNLVCLEELRCYGNTQIDTLEGIEFLPNLKTIICDSKFWYSLPTEATRLKNLGFFVNREARSSEDWKDVKDIVIYTKKVED